MNAYPSYYFLRGITGPECIIKNKVRSNVFDFNEYTAPNKKGKTPTLWLTVQPPIGYSKRQKIQSVGSPLKQTLYVITDTFTSEVK